MSKSTTNPAALTKVESSKLTGLLAQATKINATAAALVLSLIKVIDGIKVDRHRRIFVCIAKMHTAKKSLPHGKSILIEACDIAKAIVKAEKEAALTKEQKAKKAKTAKASKITRAAAAKLKTWDDLIKTVNAMPKKQRIEFKKLIKS